MDELEKFIEATGALAEALGLFRDELQKRGFDDEESLQLCIAYLRSAFGASRGEG